MVCLHGEVLRIVSACVINVQKKVGQWVGVVGGYMLDLNLTEIWGPLTAGAFPEEGTKGLQLKENSSVFLKGLFSQ